MAAINYFSETSTSYKTKLGEVNKSDVLEINQSNQLVISDELFETLYSQKESKTKKTFSLREAHGNYHSERNEKFNHITKRFEKF